MFQSKSKTKIWQCCWIFFSFSTFCLFHVNFIFLFIDIESNQDQKVLLVTHTIMCSLMTTGAHWVCIELWPSAWIIAWLLKSPLITDGLKLWFWQVELLVYRDCQVSLSRFHANFCLFPFSFFFQLCVVQQM